MGSLVFIDAIRRRKDDAMQAAWDDLQAARALHKAGQASYAQVERAGHYAMALIAQRNRDYMAARNGCKQMVVAS